MEIVYLYIKNFRNLKNQNINFGGEYRFQYNESTNELITLKNELYIKDFYDINGKGAKVLNVSSIIGKNGTGKSSILNFIKNNFSKGSNLQDEMILVIKNNLEYKIISTIDLKYDIELFGKNINLQKKDKPRDKMEHFFDFGYKLRGLDNTDLIYFSNIFDGSASGSVSGLYDISTNCLISEDFNLGISQGTISKNTNQIGFHLVEDIFRQLRFLTNEISKDKINFNLPEELSIRVNIDYISNDKSLSDEKFNNEYKKFSNIILKDYFKYTTQKEQSLNLFISHIILNLVKELLSFSAQNDELKFNFNYNSKFNLTSNKILFSNMSFEQCIEFFFDEVYNQVNNQKINAPFIKTLVNNNKSFINYITENEKYFSTDLIFNKEAKIFIELRDKDIIDKFLELYLKTYSVNSYLHFGWRNISSGEKALLNIYSRFFSISNSQKFGQKLAKNIIILIDEGDVYLHPAWQKKFLKNLLDYLPIIFELDERGEKRNLQIIFTSNSPIPASDLLNANTIFLENIIEEGFVTIVKDSLNDQKETFASNIHTLLSDSFFVNDGLMGDFAVYKINEIIHKLVYKITLSYEERENMRKLIHQIGEPVIKNKLMQMYNDCYNMGIHERLENIEKKLGL